MKTSDSAVKRILVVEDEPTIGDMCRRVLSAEGFEVDIAVNRKVAQDMIKREQYDLCLIDIRTPTMNGKELYRWLKQEKTELIKGVVFTTGDVMSGDTQAFLESSGRTFLPKPFTPDELLSAMNKPLKQLRDECDEYHHTRR